ncbi:hypothetical protein RQP54_09985 [Curvibacter sp. APW13]|uniref:hypothetical protein n=1 Tax=Curvibacter sp. APW13 TaxID=3077236 RepID=UPI0028DD78B1|nr:hypothetical protein [Curvibacter sp. APW13]MDT8991193.1 hypothetical protein [Curvibacter sp. APW13]
MPKENTETAGMIARQGRLFTMFDAIGRFFAVLVGLVFVVSGGVCTAIDTTFFFSQLSSGSIAPAFLAVLGIALSLGLLRVGLWMMGVKRKPIVDDSAIGVTTGPGIYVGKRFVVTILSISSDGGVLERQQLRGIGLRIDGTAVIVDLQDSASGATLAVRIWDIKPAPADFKASGSIGEELDAPDFIVEIRRPAHSSSSTAN